MYTYRNFIGGEWRKSESGKTRPNVNPANADEVLGLMPLSTRQEAEAAVAAAKAAAPGWRGTPAPARGTDLMKVVEALRERQEELAQITTREEGKAIRESRLEVFKAIFLRSCWLVQRIYALAMAWLKKHYILTGLFRLRSANLISSRINTDKHGFFYIFLFICVICVHP